MVGKKAMLGCMCYQHTPCSISDGLPMHSVAGPFTFNRQKLPIGRHIIPASAVIELISEFL